MGLRPRIPALLAAALVATASAGCVTRPVKESVFDQKHTKVFLRSHGKVERGFEHPAIIAPVRIAHVLSRIDLRTDPKKGSQRTQAIPTQTLYTIAEGVSKGLSKAGPDQEVVVMSIRKHKRLGIFDRDYLTSFVTYVMDDRLYVHLARSDWEVPARRKDRLPEPKIGEQVMDFRILPSRSMTVVDPQSLAIAWRDPIFGKATRTRITPGGRVVRRTILMQSPDEETPAEDEAESAPAMPENLSPETLRQLADLEEERRGGEITESEYNLRRLEILRADAPAQ